MTLSTIPEQNFTYFPHISFLSSGSGCSVPGRRTEMSDGFWYTLFIYRRWVQINTNYRLIAPSPAFVFLTSLSRYSNKGRWKIDLVLWAVFHIPASACLLDCDYSDSVGIGHLDRIYPIASPHLPVVFCPAIYHPDPAPCPTPHLTWRGREWRTLRNYHHSGRSKGQKENLSPPLAY